MHARIDRSLLPRQAIILTAPSGTGKTSLARALQKRMPHLGFSISATTRQKRPEEKEGKQYYFITKQTFDRRRALGHFLEYEEVYPSIWYGTLGSEIQRLQKAGFCPLFDMDVHGALRLKAALGARALALFITPPDMQTLEKRLRERGTESEDQIEARLARADEEMKAKAKFDRIIENDTFEVALEHLQRQVSAFLSPLPPPPKNKKQPKKHP